MPLYVHTYKYGVTNSQVMITNEASEREQHSYTYVYVHTYLSLRANRFMYVESHVWKQLFKFVYLYENDKSHH